MDLHLQEFQPRDVRPAPRGRRPREFLRALIFVSPLLCLNCTSCRTSGSSATSTPPPPASVTVMPNSAQLFQGGKEQFNAVVGNASSSAVIWQVKGTTSGPRKLKHAPPIYEGGYIPS